jgi:hypothetical protein
MDVKLELEVSDFVPKDEPLLLPLPTLVSRSQLQRIEFEPLFLLDVPFA